MVPVKCVSCGAGVLARKSSWDQTTVQWSTDALASCVERAPVLPPSERPNRNAFLGCPRLTASLRDAAVRGTLPIQDEEPLRTNPEASQ